TQLIERVAERFGNRGLGAGAGLYVGLGELRQEPGKPPCRIGAAAVVVFGALQKAVGGGRQVFDIVLVGRRRLALVRVHGRIDFAGRLANELYFLVLVFGGEVG